jgi:hypothetical protein
MSSPKSATVILTEQRGLSDADVNGASHNSTSVAQKKIGRLF